MAARRSSEQGWAKTAGLGLPTKGSRVVAAELGCANNHGLEVADTVALGGGAS
jgi:hypothetical protein